MIVAVLVHVVSSVATLQQISQQNGGLNAGNSCKESWHNENERQQATVWFKLPDLKFHLLI